MNIHYHKIMSVGAFFGILLLQLAMCHSPNNVAPQEELSGVFQVDSLVVATQVVVRAESSKIPGQYLAVTIHYHFQHEPGAVNHATMIVEDSIGMGLFLDAIRPTPIGQSTHLVLDTQLDSTWLVGQDSLSIALSYRGAFWDYDWSADTLRAFTETFNWDTLCTIPVLEPFQ